MYVVGGSADNVPVGAPTRGERFYQVRPILERQEPRPTLHAEDTPRRGVRLLSSQTSVQPSSLTRAVARADSAIQHRDRKRSDALLHPLRSARRGVANGTVARTVNDGSMVPVGPVRGRPRSWLARCEPYTEESTEFDAIEDRLVFYG